MTYLQSLTRNKTENEKTLSKSETLRPHPINRSKMKYPVVQFRRIRSRLRADSPSGENMMLFFFSLFFLSRGIIASLKERDEQKNTEGICLLKGQIDGDKQIIDRQIGRKIDRQIDGQVEKQIDRKLDGQMDTLIVTLTLSSRATMHELITQLSVFVDGNLTFSVTLCHRYCNKNKIDVDSCDHKEIRDLTTTLTHQAVFSANIYLPELLKSRS